MALADQHERGLLDRFVGLGVGHEGSRAVVDRRPQALEGGPVPEDVHVDPHLVRLVEPGRVECDRGRSQDPVIAAGVAGDDVVDDDAALDQLDRRVREIGRRGHRRARLDEAAADDDERDETEAERTGE